jgi:hypothetical protein
MYGRIRQADNDEYYSLIVGENHEDVWKTTDTYPDKRDARHAMHLVGITDNDIEDETTANSTKVREEFKDPAGVENAKTGVTGFTANEDE